MRRPCRECPWVKATPPGQFPPERYRALANTTGSPGKEAHWEAPWFACHKAADGEEFYCAGWLAAVGLEHLGVRISVSRGLTPAEALRPGDDWPELHPDYDSLLRTHG